MTARAENAQESPAMSPLHAAARQRGEANIKVFPCDPGTKKPATVNGFYDASADIKQIDAWWTSNPNFNIATCPEDSGHCVLDYDIKNGGHGLKNRAALGLDKFKTHQIKTPSGGIHDWFVGSLPSSASKLAPGIDVRGVGGYVLLPPSRIDGKEYVVINDSDPAPLPEIIKEKLATASHASAKAAEGFIPDHPRDIARTIAYLKHADPAIEYHGSDARTVKVADDVGDLGISEDKCFDLIWEYYIPRCDGQFTEDWVKEKITNAYQYRQNEIGCHALGDPQQIFDEALKNINANANNSPGQGGDAGGDEAQQKEEAEKPFLYIRDRATQLNSPAPEMQIETILPARKVVMVTGATGSGKTYGVLEMVTAICMDRLAFGKYKVFDPGPVAAFLGEDCREVEQSRLVVLEQHYGRPLQGLFYTVETAIPLDDPNLFEKYCDELRRLEKQIGRIACIFNDTLKRSLGSLSPNDAETGMLFTSVMEKLAAEFKCSIICAAHPPKNGGNEAIISGSGSFMDNVSIAMNLKRIEGRPFDIECSFPKFRCGPQPEPFTIRGTPVRLPTSVAGITHDMVFTALTGDQIQRAADRGGAIRAENEEIRRVLDAYRAHTLPHGITTRQLAEGMVGDPKHFEEEDYKQKVGKKCSGLDNGTRGKKQRNGKESRPRYEGWFEKDYRNDPKGITKWFCPSPEVRAAAAQETEAPCR